MQMDRSVFGSVVSWPLERLWAQFQPVSYLDAILSHGPIEHGLPRWMAFIPAAIGLSLLLWLWVVAKRGAKAPRTGAKPSSVVNQVGETARHSWPKDLESYKRGEMALEAFLERWRGVEEKPLTATDIVKRNAEFWARHEPEIKAKCRAVSDAMVNAALSIYGGAAVKWPSSTNGANADNILAASGFYRDANPKHWPGQLVVMNGTNIVKELERLYYPYPSDGVPAWKFKASALDWAYVYDFKPYEDRHSSASIRPTGAYAFSAYYFTGNDTGTYSDGVRRRFTYRGVDSVVPGCGHEGQFMWWEATAINDNPKEVHVRCKTCALDVVNFFKVTIEGKVVRL